MINMKKKLLFTFFICLLGFLNQSFAQQKPSLTAVPLSKEGKSETKSLKPEDATPAKFATKEEMDTSLPKKKANIIEMIESGKYEGERLRILREELWRFENAIVAPK